MAQPGPDPPALRLELLAPVLAREVALQGPAGCTLMRLWQLLGSALGCPLGDNAKHLAWRHALALATAGDLRFCLSPADAGTDVGTADPRLASHVNAQGVAGLHVVASVWLRSAAVGVFDTEQGPETLNSTQRYLLSAVGTSRSVGLLQTEACRATGVAANNFFYQVQRLEQRGLLVKQQVTAAGAHGGVVSTSALLLPQYHAGFTAVAAARGAQAGGDVEMVDADAAGPSTAGGPTPGATQRKQVGSLLGDYATCASVCQHLETCPGKSCTIYELKQLLEVGAAKHRVWRRVVQHLKAAGCITVGRTKGAAPATPQANGGDGGDGGEDASDDDDDDEQAGAAPGRRTSSPVVTLLKPWVTPTSSALGPVQQSAPSLLTCGATRSVLYADVPMETQVMGLIAAAGPQGITHTALLSALGLTYTDRDTFARVTTRLVPADVVVSTMGHQGRISAKMFRVSEDVELPVEYTPGATADQLVTSVAAPDAGGAAGDAGALALVNPGAPSSSWANLADHRRKMILDAVAANGIVLRTHMQGLIQASLPPDAPKIDRKTVDNAAAALEKEGLLRTWTVEVPVKRTQGKMRAHLLLLPPLQPGQHPDTGKDMVAAHAAIDKFISQAVRRQRKSMKATREARGGASGGGATPLLGAADDDDEDEEAGAGDGAPEAELPPATQRARCRRRLGVTRARCTRTQHLHAWLHASTAGAQPGQWRAFTVEEVVTRMPVHLVLLFLGFKGDERDKMDDMATGDDEASFSEAFCLRMETVASAEGDDGLVSALSGKEQRLLLNARTKFFLTESTTLLLGLGLLQVEAPPPPALAPPPPSAVKWGLHTALVVAPSAVLEEPDLGEGSLAAVTAATPWTSSTLVLATPDDVAAYWKRLQAAVAPQRGPKEYERLAALHLPCTRLPQPAKLTNKEAWKRPSGAAALKPGQRAALFAHARTLWPRWRASAADEDADAEDAATSAAIQALTAKLGCNADEAARLMRDERAAFLRECTVSAGAALTAVIRGAAAKAAKGKGKAKRAAADPEATDDDLAPKKRRRAARGLKMTVDQVRQVVANAARTAVDRGDMMVPSSLLGAPGGGGARGDDSGGRGGPPPPAQPALPVVEAPARFGSHRLSGAVQAGRAGPSAVRDVRMDSGDESEESESESEEEPAAPTQALVVVPPGRQARAQPAGKGAGAKQAGGARQTQVIAPSTPVPQPPAGPLTVASRCAMELLKLHLLHGVAASLAQAAPQAPDAPAVAPPPWSGLCGPASSWSLQQALDAHSPGQEAIRGGLRTLGEAAVADGLARLRAAGHVTSSGAPQLTRAFWEAAASAPGFELDVGAAVASLASRVAATVAGGEPEHPAGVDEHPAGGGSAPPGDEQEVYSVVLFPGTGVPRPAAAGAGASPALHSGDVAAALTAMAAGAARLVMAPPREAGGGLDALVPPQQEGPPKAEALYRSLQLRLARTSGDDDADDMAQEGGGESGFPASNAGGGAGKPPGGGGRAAPDGAKRGGGRGGEGAAAPRDGGGGGACQPDVTLDSCCSRWRTAKKGVSDAGLRAAWAALQASGANGVSAPAAAAAAQPFTETELSFLAEPCGACLAVSAADCDQAGTVYVRASDVGPYVMPLPSGAGHPSHSVALILHDLCAARACALAMRLPGAPEHVLTHHLSAVAPSHASALLHQLVAAGKLIARSVRTAPPPGPPSRLQRPAADEAEVAHFFPAPAAVQCV